MDPHRRRFDVFGRLFARRIDIDQRGPLTVYGNFDLLAFAHDRPVARSGRRVIKRQLKYVVAVGWEIMDDGNSATRSHGCALHVLHLIQHARNVVRRITRRLWIADRLAADLAGGAKISRHQRGRDRQHTAMLSKP